MLTSRCPMRSGQESQWWVRVWVLLLPPPHLATRGRVATRQTKVDGAACDWDGEVGCWREPDGSEHVVGHNEKAKAKAEEERLRRVREELARE